jgi:hypothetical protein
MLISHAELPVRPVRARGESLVGYIYRYYFDNFHDVPKTLRQAVRDYYTGNTPDEALQVLKKAIGPEGQRNCRLSDYHGHDVKLLRGYRTSGQRSHYSSIRYCPTCFGELGFLAEFWMLPQVEACPYHRCRLLTRCSNCHRSVTWSNTRPGWICRCGAKFTDGKHLVAVDWQIALVTIISQATDVEVPHSDHGRSASPALSLADKYSLQEVYEFFAAIKLLHRELTRRRTYYSYQRWPYNIKCSGHNEPTAWIMRFATANQESRKKRFRRALIRWHFCGNDTLLVERNSLGPLVLMVDTLKPFQPNPLVNLFSMEAESLLREYHTGIAFLGDTYFHPGVLSCRRTTYLTLFAKWWHGLSNQLMVIESKDQFSKAHSLSMEEYDVKFVIELLNWLILAAVKNRKFECYFKLAKRWRIPAVLQRRLDASNILEVLVEYLSGLEYSEFLFFRDLLTDAADVSDTGRYS